MKANYHIMACRLNKKCWPFNLANQKIWMSAWNRKKGKRIRIRHTGHCTVIRFVWVSAKFGTVVSVKGTLVEAKMCTFTLESMHVIFKKCPIYTHDDASAQFSTNSHEADYSVDERDGKKNWNNTYCCKRLPVPGTRATEASSTSTDGSSKTRKNLPVSPC